MDQAGFTHWSVSHNKGTTVPERPAAALPDNVWSPAAHTRWRDGREITEQHAGLRHPVAGSESWPVRAGRRTTNCSGGPPSWRTTDAVRTPARSWRGPV